MSKIIKNSVNTQIKNKFFFFLPFSYSAQQLWIHNCRVHFGIWWYIVLNFIVKLDKKKSFIINYIKRFGVCIVGLLGIGN